MKIAVLALQGDFFEHERFFRSAGAETFQLRQKRDLMQPFDALVLPGGESTCQGKLLRELDMLEILKQRIADGLPVLATCAGVILLARQLKDDPTVHLGTLDVIVQRNAYGRQSDSFHVAGTFAGMENISMSFIRAPQIEFCSPRCEVLAEHAGRITAVRQGNQVAMTFHPELDDDFRVAEYFIQKVAGSQNI